MTCTGTAGKPWCNTPAGTLTQLVRSRLNGSCFTIPPTIACRPKISRRGTVLLGGALKLDLARDLMVHAGPAVAGALVEGACGNIRSGRDRRVDAVAAGAGIAGIASPDIRLGSAAGMGILGNGHNDAVVVFFMVAALALAARGATSKGALALGTAIAVKWWPVLLMLGYARATDMYELWCSPWVSSLCSPRRM